MSGRSARRPSLGVIIYSRANAVYSEARWRTGRRLPEPDRLQGRLGNIEQMTRIYSGLGDRLLYIGGLPTAELYALPYLKLGLTTYSSAIFNFLPPVRLGLLRRGAHAATRLRVQGPERLRHPLLRSAQPQGRVRSEHHQGRHEGDRPPGRTGPLAADRSDEAEVAELAALIKKVSHVSTHGYRAPDRGRLDRRRPSRADRHRHSGPSTRRPATNWIPCTTRPGPTMWPGRPHWRGRVRRLPAHHVRATGCLPGSIATKIEALG